MKEGGYFEFAESGFFLHSDDNSLVNSKLKYYFDEWHKAIKAGGIKVTVEDVSRLCAFRAKGSGILPKPYALIPSVHRDALYGR